MDLKSLINAENTLFGHKLNLNIKSSQRIEMADGDIVVHEQYYSQQRLDKMMGNFFGKNSMGLDKGEDDASVDEHKLLDQMQYGYGVEYDDYLNGEDSGGYEDDDNDGDWETQQQNDYQNQEDSSDQHPQSQQNREIKQDEKNPTKQIKTVTDIC